MDGIRTYKTEEIIGKGNVLRAYEETKNTAVGLHTHEFIEIVYVRSGKAVETVDGKQYSVHPGDMLFINYGSTHAFVPEGEYVYVNICFSPETIGNSIITRENAFALLCLTAFDDMRCDAEGGKISFFGREKKDVDSIVDAMIREYNAKETSWERVMESYLNVLITKMLRRTRLTTDTDQPDRMWQELTEYIDGNPNADLSLPTLAKKCFYHPAYFSRVFKEKFGVSLIEYVNGKRVENAVRLLRDTDISVDEILLQVGFSDRSNFYRVFSKFTGSTPTDIRKNRKK